VRRTCFDGMSQLDGVRRDKSLPQHMEAVSTSSTHRLRAEPPLAAFTY